jgi:fucose 4-O-acetylase-like acetyltransferase
MRIAWVDHLRALGIFLVVFAHMIPYSPLLHYMGSFVLPIFFFASGYLFDRSKYSFGQFFKRRFRSLIVPYLFFASVSFLFWFLIVRHFSISGRALMIDPWKPLIGIFYGVGSGEWGVPLSTALWFLPCLFVVEMMYYFVRHKYLLPGFAILGYLATLLPVRLPWSVDVAFAAIIIYGVGDFSKGLRLPYQALPLLFLLNVVFGFLNGPVDMNNVAYGNMFYFYVAAGSGVLFYAGLCKLIGQNRVTEYVACNAIALIGLVRITWFIMNGLTYTLFGTKLEQTDLGSSLVFTVLQISLTIPAIYCINRWLPFLSGRTLTDRHREDVVEVTGWR